MDPRKVTIRGITTAHRAGFTLDLNDVPEGLIAISGRNGTGKTTLMAALCPLSIWAQDPSRGTDGSLSQLAVGTDAYLALELQHGDRTIEIRRELNARTGKHDAYVLVDGVDQGTGGSVNITKELLARLLPPQRIVLAAVYAAQHGRGSFIGMTEQARRDLFAELLGLEELQRLSAEAKRVADACEDRAPDLARRIAAEEIRCTQLAEARDEKEAAESDAARVAAQLAPLRERVEERQRVLALLVSQAEDRERAARAAVAALDSARDDEERAGEALRSVSARRERLRAFLARAPEIALAYAGLMAWRTEYLEVRSAWDAARESSRSADRAQIAAKLEARDAADRIAALQTLQARAQDLAKAREMLQQLDADLMGHRADGVLRRRAHEQAAAAFQEDADRVQRQEAARASDLAAINTRIAALQPQADVLGRVPCGGQTFWGLPGDFTRRQLRSPEAADCAERRECASCELLAGARSAEQEIPSLLAERDRLTAQVFSPDPSLAEQAVGALAVWRAHEAEEKDLAQRQLQMRTRVDVLRPGIPDNLDALLAEQVAAHNLATARVDALLVDVGKATAAEEAAAAALALVERAGPPQEQQTRVEAENGQLAAAQRDAAECEREFDAATVALARAATRTADAAAEQARCAEALAANQDADLDAKRDELARSQASVAALDAEHRRHLDRLARATGVESALREAPATLEALRGIHAALLTMAATHRLLERGLGRKGVQAHELDNAGPQVAELVNELVEACYGDRFTMEIVTQVPGAKKGVMREVFEIRIHDNLASEPRTFDQLSGGEQVIMDQALKAALAVLMARRSPTPLRTLFRDECDGAFDAANARLYPLLMRRAMELTGATRCFFISQNPEVVEQADAQIVLGEGAPRIEVLR